MPTPERLDEISKLLKTISETTSNLAVELKSTKPTKPPKWKLILNEQFDGKSGLEWRKGRATTASGGHPGYNSTEKAFYLPDRANVENGKLTLSAIKKPLNVVNDKAKQGQFKAGDVEDIWYSNGDSGHWSYQTGTVTTAPDRNGMIGGLSTGDWTPQPASFEFLYGQIEARIKVPKGPGLWPAFWLLQSDGTWPPEIDVMEIVDPEAKHVAQHLHYGKTDTDFTQYHDKGYPAGVDLSEDFHVYGVDWQPDYIRWYLDGKLIQEYTDKANIPSKPMYILLNLAIGGDWPEKYGKLGDSTPFPAEMVVDFVKVWQLNK